MHNEERISAGKIQTADSERPAAGGLRQGPEREREPGPADRTWNNVVEHLESLVPDLHNERQQNPAANCASLSRHSGLGKYFHNTPAIASATFGTCSTCERPAALPAAQRDRLPRARRGWQRETPRVGEGRRATAAREQRVRAVRRAVRPPDGDRLVAARIADRAAKGHTVFIYSRAPLSKARRPDSAAARRTTAASFTMRLETLCEPRHRGATGA